MNEFEKCRDFIEHNGIYRCKPGEFIVGKAPLTKYTWQIYLRRCLYDPTFMNDITTLILDKLDLSDRNVQFGACEDAGVALAISLSLRTNISMFSIKKERKSYGLLNFTEGIIKNKPVILVDDIAGSQQTFRNAKALLTKCQLPLAKQYVAVINKTLNTHDAYIDRELVSIYTCDDFAMSWTEYVAKYNKEPNYGKYV